MAGDLGPVAAAALAGGEAALAPFGLQLMQPVALRAAPAAARAARYLADGSPARFSASEGGVLLAPIPDRVRDAYDTVVALELAN